MAMNVFELNVNINTTEKSEAQKALGNTSTGGLDIGQGVKINTENMSSLSKSAIAACSAVKVLDSVSDAGEKVFHTVLDAPGRWGGDVARQNEINNLVNTGHALEDFATTVGSGAIAGFAVGGVPGAIVGAVIGAAAEAVETAVELMNNYIDYTIKMQEYTLDASKSQERLGILAASHGR